MVASKSGRYGLFVSCAALAFLMTIPPSYSQSQEEPAPGTPLYGRPKTEGAMKLAPVAPPPLPAAPDKLPVAKLKVPKGFKVEAYTSGLAGVRTLRVSDKGNVIVGTWQANKIYAVTDKGKTKKVLYEGLDWPNGIALHNGTLYVAATRKSPTRTSRPISTSRRSSR